jgi:hypothetical protein
MGTPVSGPDATRPYSSELLQIVGSATRSMPNLSAQSSDHCKLWMSIKQVREAFETANMQLQDQAFSDIGRVCCVSPGLMPRMRTVDHAATQNSMSSFALLCSGPCTRACIAARRTIGHMDAALAASSQIVNEPAVHSANHSIASVHGFAYGCDVSIQPGYLECGEVSADG